MKLNHINLVVSNVAATIKIFETYFNFKCTDIKGDNIVAILTGADDFTLVIMTDKNEQIVYPNAFHIGFMQDSEDEVTKIYTALKMVVFTLLWLRMLCSLQNMKWISQI